MQQLKTMIPLDANIKDAYNTGSDEEQNFVQNLSLFLCTFLKEHGTLVEKKPEMQVRVSANFRFIERHSVTLLIQRSDARIHC